MKSSTFFLLIILCYQSKAQDIVFKNPSERPMLLLDTSIIVSGRSISVLVGPEYKLRQNTIFFNSPFKISDSKIDTFNIKASFFQHFIIRNSTFQKNIMLDSTNFDTLFIQSSSFKNPVTLHKTRINNFRFTQNNLVGNLRFSECWFDYLNTENSVFPGDVNFTNSTLSHLFFKHTTFNGDLNLSGNLISGKLIFDSCFFQKSLFLSNLDSAANPLFSFHNTLLPDTLDLSFNNRIAYSIDLTKVNTHENRRRCNILLYGTDLDNINLDYFYFRLIFPLGLSKDMIIAQYEGLLENFKKRNYLESYRLLDIEYREYKARQENPFWWLQKLWSNFGYNPERVFYWTALFIFLFTIINSFCLNILLKDVYQVDFVPLSNKKIKRPRFWFSLIYTAAIFFALPIKWDKINFSNKGGTIYLFLQFIVGMICLWFIGKFIL